MTAAFDVTLVYFLSRRMLSVLLVMQKIKVLRRVRTHFMYRALPFSYIAVYPGIEALMKLLLNTYLLFGYAKPADVAYSFLECAA